MEITRDNLDRLGFTVMDVLEERLAYGAEVEVKYKPKEDMFYVTVTNWPRSRTWSISAHDILTAPTIVLDGVEKWLSEATP